MDKYIAAFLYNELTTTNCSNIDKSHKQDDEQNKLGTREYVHYNSLLQNLKTRKTNIWS